MFSVLVDGQTKAVLSVFDRGCSYGHGLFETIRMRGETPLLWQAHMARLRRGAAVLAIPFDALMEDKLRQEAAELAAAFPHSVVRITLTAGQGPRGYLLPEEVKPTRVVACFPVPAYPDERHRLGVKVRDCRHQLALNPALAGIKHLNRLEQVLARAEWSDPDIEEGLLSDTSGALVEGTMSNIMAVVGGELITPAIIGAGVRGVMRDYLLQQAMQAAIPVREVVLPAAAFQAADELLLCNSVMGIWPIRAWDERPYAIGPVTRELQAEVARLFLDAEPAADSI